MAKNVDLIGKSISVHDSLSLLRLHGRNSWVLNPSTASYQLFCGQVRFDIGNCSVDLLPGDTITIPAHTLYRDDGEALLLCRNIPPYNEQKVIVFD